MKTLADRAILLAGGLVVGLVLAEGAVRVFAPQPLGVAEPPPLLRGELTAPGDHPVRTSEYDVVVHVNADGFVDREWGPRTEARVVVIGDSFVQAAQVPLAAGFGRVLDGALPEAEVLSMGVPGAGTATALGVLETYALPRSPDVVLLGFLVANDVLNNHPLLEGKDDKPFYALRDGELVPSDAASAAARSDTLIRSPLHAARWVGRTLATRRATKRKLELGGGVPVDLRVHDPGCAEWGRPLDLTVLMPEDGEGLNVRREVRSDGYVGPDPLCAAWDDAWAVTDALIAEMARRCDDAGVRFGVVLFPDAVVATRAGREDAARRWPEVARWDVERAWRRARETAERHAPTLDLLPAFQAADAAGEGPLFYAQDGHWTPAGHALAAEASAPFVAGLLRGT